MNIGLSRQHRQEVCEGLSRLLADVYATYLKSQNFHWNLSGKEFYSLHLLFEKHYEALAEECDEIAERMRALGFYVEASFSAFKEMTNIKDEGQVLVIPEMLTHLISAHETVCRHGRNLSKLAERAEDAGTVDMLGKLIREHEKMIWMLRSSQN